MFKSFNFMSFKLQEFWLSVMDRSNFGSFKVFTCVDIIRKSFIGPFTI